MLEIPSLPFYTNASLPEVIWVAVAVLTMGITYRAWAMSGQARNRVKNMIRATASTAACGMGIIAMLSPPIEHPTWLSVLNPMVYAFLSFCMGLLSLLEDEARSAEPPFTIKES